MMGIMPFTTLSMIVDSKEAFEEAEEEEEEEEEEVTTGIITLK
jgi:hypothetical protein